MPNKEYLTAIMIECDRLCAEEMGEEYIAPDEQDMAEFEEEILPIMVQAMAGLGLVIITTEEYRKLIED